MRFETASIHGSRLACDQSGAISVPIYQSATFSHPDVGSSTGYDYSRTQNPTREHLEKIMAELEGGADALAFTTGMAAISAVVELFLPGDHLLASNDLYGGSFRHFFNIAAKNGIEFELVDTTSPGHVEAAIRPATRALFIETPSNPLMKVTDIAEMSKIASHHGLLLIVDNTFLTPLFQMPLALGADLVIHSGTKYLGGHNDTLAGFVIVRNNVLAERLRFIFKTTGACLAPFDSWLMIRSLKTLSVRLRQQEANALRIADWLRSRPEIGQVYYAGLPDHPDYAVTLRQTSGFGAMISFAAESEALARKILQRVRLIRYAESLGGAETLITYPILQTHADIPVELRAKLGIDQRLLRLSAGLENVLDLISDLDQAIGGS